MRHYSAFTRRRAAVHRKFEPIIESNDTSRQERKDILDQMDRELQKITDEEDAEIDTGLFLEAARFDIDVPPRSEAAMWDEREKGFFLSATGRLHLRRAIDEERTRRREIAAWWWKTVVIPALAATTGLIGAMTGLFAVLHHK